MNQPGRKPMESSFEDTLLAFELACDFGSRDEKEKVMQRPGP